MKKILIAGALCLAFATNSFAQNGSNYWARLNKTHPETTIDALVKAAPEDTSTAGYRISLTYDGQSRELSTENKELMEATGLKGKKLKDYKYELLFKHKDQEFWLPVQTELIEELQIELRPNEPVMLYAIVLQIPTKEDENRTTLLVEEFKIN